MELPGARWRSNWPSDWDVWRVAETASTNADLAAAAGSGAPQHTALVADHQTAGRGRLGRTWDAPPGVNLLVSLLFRHSLELPHLLTQHVAVAAARAVERVSGDRAELKWPNDLLLGEAKLAGILAQAGGQGGRLDHVVVGIGVNVGWAPAGAARLSRGTPEEVLRALLEELDDLAADPDAAFVEYRRRLATLGRAVRVELADTVFLGRAVGVEPDGALLVEVDGTVRRVDIGDVVHLRVTDS